MTITFEAAARAIGASVFDAEAAPNALHVVTDTRMLTPGDAFLALRGERFDGHDYAHEAVARGASVLILDDPAARISGTAALVVDDTLRAYMALAHAARLMFKGRIIAITGSAGKTTTRAFSQQLLVRKYGDRILASPANENNEIGVSKLLLEASNDDHDAIVVEMGARHYGDIATLVDVAEPHVGILTNVGEAHLEIMGSRERLEDTKWALFSRGARAVLNANDAMSRARYKTLDRLPHWFAALEPNAPVRAIGGRATLLAGTDKLNDTDGIHVRERRVDVRLPGAHNRANLAAAIAGALELDVDLDDIVATIPLLELPAGRYESLRLNGDVRLIYDAYNANASGTIAALDAFAEENAQRRIAVLGSMAELGDEAVDLHVRVGKHVAKSGVDTLLVGGDFADDLAHGARSAGLQADRIIHFATNPEAARWLRKNTQAGDVVLLKGSRKYKLEEIVSELMS